MPAFVLGEFATTSEMLSATRKVREAGFNLVDTHSPYPVEGTSEALDLPRSPVPLATLIGGLTGMGLGYSMQLFCNAIDFPINVGGRPPHAFPSFIPITFELSILFGSFAALLSLIFLCRFPQPYHPTQEVEAFRTATTHAFWLSVELPAGLKDEIREVSDQLRALGAKTVSVVEGEPEPQRHRGASPVEEPA